MSVGHSRPPTKLSGDLGRMPSQVCHKPGLSQDQVEILRLCRQERTLVELMNASGRRNRTKYRDSFIKPLLEEGFLVSSPASREVGCNATGRRKRGWRY